MPAGLCISVKAGTWLSQINIIMHLNYFIYKMTHQTKLNIASYFYSINWCIKPKCSLFILDSYEPYGEATGESVSLYSQDPPSNVPTSPNPSAGKDKCNLSLTSG